MAAALEQAKRLDAAFHVGTYGRKDVIFVEGSGMTLVDDAGREYLDFVSGLGVVNLGHSHPAVVEAVREQVGRLTHVSNLYHVEHQGAFAQAIVFFKPSRKSVTNSILSSSRIFELSISNTLISPGCQSSYTIS